MHLRLTFAEWEACLEGGGCQDVDDEGWGRGTRPVGGSGSAVAAGAAATVTSLQLASPAARSPPASKACAGTSRRQRAAEESAWRERAWE